MKQLANRKHPLRRAVSALLALVLMLGMLPPASGGTAQAHWADDYVQTLVDWGVMRGDVDGNLNVDKDITRAEFVTMINRAFGYSADIEHPFEDVQTKDWYNNDIGIAYNMGYFKGMSETEASPNTSLTREQAVVLIGRNLLLDEKLSESLGFSDSRTFSDWSRGMVESAISAGFISGYDDGSFQPQNAVTRGEVAAMLVRALGNVVNESGTHELGGVYGNVTLSTSGVKLKNTTIAGDLYITGGLELGDVLLENVNVLGKIVIAGTGESNKGDSSVILRNVEAGELVLNSMADQFVTLRAEGTTQIDFTNVKTSAHLDDQTKSGDGLLYIELNGKAGMNVTLAGTIEEVLNCTPQSTLVMAQGTAQFITIDEKATESTMDIKNGASVNRLNLDVATNVTGKGDVDKIYINAAGSTVEMLPDSITIRPGIDATVNGETMDTQAGQESSSTPRILTGYPKTKNLAPNSVEILFSTNKKGTLYWALTASTDGPVSASDLVEVKDYNTKIQQQGTVDITEAKKEFTTKISKLLADGSYYVSAVLVDSRGNTSPVKYVTFTTPDGSAPDFADGYPTLTQITKNSAQVAVMPTKSSILYYAILPKGAAAPTIADFKAGAIGGDLGKCPEDGIAVKKNEISLEMIAEDLTELTDYDLYLCLIDADNGKDSGVEKLSFSTIDGTAPELMDAVVTGVQATALKLSTSMNEDGTIYWVAVKEGQEYPVYPSNMSPDATEEEKMKVFQLQVINGSGNVVKSGKSTAKANADVSLNISGLDKESAYDIYYVAEDKAGNCSEVKKLTQKTLDTTPPSVKQEFSKTADAAGEKPHADTDITLTFSESVRTNYSTDSIFKLYEDYQKNPSDDHELLSVLKQSIQLWDISNASASYQVKHTTSDKDNTSAWIDYTKVKIWVENTGELILYFKHGEAINLSSGSTYQFILNDIIDTSDAKNPMRANPFKMDAFNTVFAQVNLTSRASSSTSLSTLPTLKGETGDVDVDMRFWMSPQSTSSVNDGVYYDIWFETSNVIIFMDVYCRVLKSESGSAVPVTDKTSISMFGDNNSKEAGNGWFYLGAMEIRASSGTARGSVSSLIYGTNNTNLPKLNSLNEDYTYEFIVDVTSIDGNNDELSWSHDVTLNVLVPAGQDLSGTDYAKQEPFTNDISNIANPEDFSVSRKFIDTKTPQFRDGYPVFDSGDMMVNMEVMLDRAGTLYYVIAPVTTDGTTWKSSVNTVITDKTTGNTVSTWFTPYEKKEDGTDNKGTAFPAIDGTSLTSENPLGTTRTDYELKEPSNDTVVLLVDKGADSTQIKTDSVSVGNTRKVITVNDLEPETTYIAYIVLKGESQTYSPVYLFQFKTTEVGTPTITLNVTGGSNVATTTSMTSELSWALFSNKWANDTLGGDDMLFSTYVPDTKKTAYANACTSLKVSSATVTVLDALKITVGTDDKRSLFDAYGNDYIKQYVLELIQGEKTSEKPFVSNGSGTFTQEVTQTVSPDGMNVDVTYYFIAAARSVMGTSYGFKAVGGVHVADNTPPVLKEAVTDTKGALKMDNAGSNAESSNKYTTTVNTAVESKNPAEYYYAGTVTLTFSEPIYQLVKKGDGIETEIVTITSEKIIKRLETTMRIESATVNGNTITIKFCKAQLGNNIIIFKDGSICDASGNVQEQGANLKLTLRIVEQESYLEDIKLYQLDFATEWIAAS